MSARYSTEQLAFLQSGYVAMRIPELTKAFNMAFGANKSEGTIRSTLRNHGMTCGRTSSINKGASYIFTPKQVAFIKKMYCELSVIELAGAINARFGISRTPQQIKTFVTNHRILSGRTGCFENGHEPANKGVKGWQAGGRSAETRFKKGSVPPNSRPLGHERICPKDGYILIKVDEINPHTGFRGHYRHKHVVVWESLHGPVPEGMCVAFVDGDKLNCEPENLELLSKAEICYMNRNFPGHEGELRPTVVAISRTATKASALARASRSSA